MRWSWVALLVAVAVRVGSAQEPAAPPAPAAPDTSQQAADKVLAAVAAKEDAALNALAAKDNPDPWLVADELCARGEFDAANAFAKSAPRLDVERLPAYVASRRGAPDANERERVVAAQEALRRGDAVRALELTDGLAEKPSVASILGLGARAGALGKLRRHPESIAALVTGARLAKEAGWLSRQARLLDEAFRAAAGISDFRAALAACEELLALQETRGQREGVAVALGNLGTCHRSLGAHGKALECHERVLRMREEVGDRAGMARALANMGNVHGSIGNHAKALECFEGALRLNEALGNRAAMAGSLTGMGNVHAALRDYTKALDCQARALGLLEGEQDRARIATIHWNMGSIHRDLGDPEMALEHFGRALEVYTELGNRVEEAQALLRIAALHRSLYDYPKALHFYELARSTNEALGNRSTVASTLVSMGIVHRAVSDYPGALECYRKALGLFELLGDRTGVATVLGNMGSAHLHSCAYAAAIECHERSLALGEELGSRALITNALGNIGGVHLTLGDDEKALRFLERAHKQAEEVADRRLAATALGNIGLIHHRRGDHAIALECQEKSRKIAEEIGDRHAASRALHAMAGIHRARRDLPKALECLQADLALDQALGDRAGVSMALCAIANVHYDQGSFARAIEFHEQSFAAAEAIDARSAMAHALWGLSSARLALGDPASAVADARRAVRLAGELATGLAEEEGARAREVFAGLFDDGAEAALRLGDPAEVCFFLESGRAATLLESLGGRDALYASTVPESLRVEEAEARAEEARAAARRRAALAASGLGALREANAALAAAQERVAEVIARIQRQAKAASSVVYPSADRVEVLAAHVRADEALVLYGLLSTSAVALIVTDRGARVVPLGEKSAIENACRGDVVPVVDLLRKLVVAPLGLSEGTRRLLVSPAGPLACVPFSLLVGDREVAYVPSGTTYGALLDEAHAGGDGVLAVGDPVYEGESRFTVAKAVHRGAARLRRLPASGEEAGCVGDVVLVRENATEARIRERLAGRPRWRALHLACHGLVDAEHPMLSSLALTATGEDDGFLTALEVFRCRIPADLAVLSACETAKGKVYRAEGIVGLTRAFMAAGAPRVLVSLWKVDDDATKALMVKFYELWNPKDGSKGLACATALKRAQEFVAGHEKWKHPRYWAAWQLWGLPD